MNKGVCAVDGCEAEVRHRDWCSKHYQRWRKHGDPTFMVNPTYGSGRRINDKGYVLLFKPDHPLAYSNGYVPEHRFVVYEAGIEVPEGFHVHHINGVRDDNRLENLEVVSIEDHTRHHRPHTFGPYGEGGGGGTAGKQRRRRERLKSEKYGDRRCAYCDVPIPLSKTGKAIYCSPICRRRAGTQRATERRRAEGSA